MILLCSILNITIAQNCNCTISQIENNTVAPCDLTIGTIVNVNSVQQFKNAISQANNNGGNMTILIADGTYEVASTASYPYLTASNVVIRSASGNRDAVVLTGGGMRDVLPDTENGIYAVGNNVTIADLTIKEVGNHAIQVIGDNLFVHNVKIQNTREQMLKGTGGGDGADNGIVQCCLFEYTAGIGPQFYIGGIDVHKGDNWMVNDNIFKNIASPSEFTAEHAVHFWRTGSNNTVERNVIINCDRGIGFGLGNDVDNGIVGGIIRNNMIYNDGNHPFDDVGIGLEHSPDTKVYNNTIYLAAYPRAIEYRWAATTNVQITNNLTNQSITSRNGGQATLTTNYTNAASSWFVNPSLGDLRLNTNNTTVVNQGTSLSEVAGDIDQTPRPQGAAFDIGAYEYVEENVVEDCPPPTMQDLPLFQMNQLTYDGAFLVPAGAYIQNSVTNICIGANKIRILSTPNNNIFEINGNSTGYTIQILDASLQVYESINGLNAPITINTANLNLPVGLCFITITNNSNNKISYKNSFIHQ